MEGSMQPTATTLLREDHRKVEDLYHRFREAKDIGDRVDLADDICKELEIHSRLEECLVYPGLAQEASAAAPVQPLVQLFGQEHGEVKRAHQRIQGSGRTARTTWTPAARPWWPGSWPAWRSMWARRRGRPSRCSRPTGPGTRPWGPNWPG